MKVCKVCPEPAQSRGYCSKHYRANLKAEKVAALETCSVDACHKVTQAKGIVLHALQAPA